MSTSMNQSHHIYHTYKRIIKTNDTIKKKPKIVQHRTDESLAVISVHVYGRLVCVFYFRPSTREL